MHAAFDVGFCMVHDFMDVTPMQLVVRHGIIREHKGAVFHIFQDFILQGLALHIRYYCGANVALVPVKHSHDNGFASCAASMSALGRKTLAAITVHVGEFSSDEGFDHLKATAFFYPRVVS